MEEPEFWNDFELIRNDVDKAIEAFYTYISMHNVASENLEIHRAMNRNSTFWSINLYALQTTFFITMGRIFDDGKDAHSVHKLISGALAHPEFFSKKALSNRKIKGQEKPPWLEKYIENAFEPGVSDLRNIKKLIKPFRKLFDNSYKDIRNSVFAHTLIKESESVSKLFGKTKISDIEDILYTLHDMLQAMWELYNNGRQLEFGKNSKNYKNRIEKTTYDVLLKIEMGSDRAK